MTFERRPAEEPVPLETTALQPVAFDSLGYESGAGVELADALQALSAAAQAAWSGALCIEPSVFAAHVAARLPRDASGATICRLHGADLYLACGIARGMPEAMALFEDRLMGEVVVALRRFRLQRAVVADLCQIVREKVMIGDPERRPKIAEYSGRGALRGWVRVVATRIALNSLRGRKAEVGNDDALLDAAASGSASPELCYLRQRHAADLRLAVDRAMQSLTAGERVLLQQHFVDGLGMEQIAKLYRVHRVTILRRMDRVLRTLRLLTARFMEQRLGCTASAADGIIGQVLGHAHLSILRHLAAAG
jgi:RNA polymerase sigma-70 factor, ECF subfamily